MPYGHASMLLLGEGSEATEPYKYDKIRPHSIRSLQFDQKVRPLSFRPEKFDLFTATLQKRRKRWGDSIYMNCQFLQPTSIQSSDFSVWQVTLQVIIVNELPPEHLEEQLFLKANAQFWNIDSVVDVLNK